MRKRGVQEKTKKRDNRKEEEKPIGKKVSHNREKTKKS